MRAVLDAIGVGTLKVIGISNFELDRMLDLMMEKDNKWRILL